jgi:prefoldin subunit 5
MALGDYPSHPKYRSQPAADKDAQITVLQEQLQTMQKQVRALEASAPPVEKQSAHVKSL